MAQSATAAVDHHGQAARFEPELPGGLLVPELGDLLHLEEVVARAERPDGGLAAQERPLGDGVRLGALERASVLLALEVGARSEAALDGPAGTVAQDVTELGLGRVEASTPPRAGGNRARELLQQRRQAVAGIFDPNVRAQQPHAARDVVADSAGRDDPVVHAERGDAADREAVAPVNVGHRIRRLDDPRQAGDVAHLLQGVVELPPLHGLASGKYPAGNAHRGLLLELPLEVRDLPHRSTPRYRPRSFSPSGS